MVSNFLLALQSWMQNFLHWLTTPAAYGQMAIAFVLMLLAWGLASVLKKRISQPVLSEGWRYKVHVGLYQARPLLFPSLLAMFLAASVDLCAHFLGQEKLLRLVAGFAIVYGLYQLIRLFVQNPLLARIIKLLVIPLALLEVSGLLGAVVHYLDQQTLELGNIKFSAYDVIRTSVFGVLLLWMGQAANHTGQQIIRQQEHLDVASKEIFAKIYQVLLFVALSLLLLQVMGVNITALAVFGGAVGVGLGFGLQSIASNFISGIILLVDRSLAVGDYIEMEDGRKGTIRKMNMRYTLLETYDGKDIMIPNEKFITTSFTNWTHTNPRQRYSIDFQVAYDTDLHLLFSMLKEVVATHPQVLSGEQASLEELPDAEIKSFGESGINIQVEFWMEGVDDGKNRVCADLMLMIWDALRQNKIQMPFPQREVRIVGERV